MNHKPIKIIQAGKQEVEEVATLFDQYRVFYGQPSDIREARGFIEERMDKKESVIYLAVEESNHTLHALGFTQLYPSFSSVSMRRIWILNDLYVHAAARKRGVGKRLVERAIRHATETNAKGVTLATAIDNVPAQQLYESLGFMPNQQYRYYHYSV